MAEKDGDDLNDPSLLQGEDGDDGIDVDGAEDGAGDAIDADGGAKDEGAQAKDDKGFEIVIEEGAEAADDGALEDDDDDGTEDAKEKHSKAVRARIERERRIARQARNQAEAERALRIQAEQRTLRARKNEIETVESSLAINIPAVMEMLKKAKEEGKTDDEIKHQTTLAKMYAQQGNVERAKLELADDEEKVKQSAAARPPSQLAQDWKRGNPWYGHERYREQSALTQALDRAVKADGFDPNDPEYYIELDRRIRRRMPELQRFQRGGQQAKQQRRDPAGAVVRRSPAGDGGNGARKGRVVLNRADLENMRTFGMDPKDPKAQKEYALQKMGGTDA
jgi:uncharacterized protein YnzC (UPF0291/DUF896 family)